MSASAPKFSVIVVNFNGRHYLSECLRSLASQSCRDFETIVVDNGSTDDSLLLARDQLGEATLIELGENLGFAAANNIGARCANGEWLALLNPDAVAARDWLEEVCAGIERHPGISVYASLQMLADSPQLLDGAGDCYHALGLAWRGDRLKSGSPPPPEGEVFGPCGAAAIYYRNAFLAVGGFEERFFCYYEDVDLAFRLRLSGNRCILLPRATIRHAASAIAGQGSDFVLYHVARNQVWTFVRCMPMPLLLVLLLPYVSLLAVKLVRSAIRGNFPLQWRAVSDALHELQWIRISRGEIQARRIVNTLAIARGFTWSLRTLVSGGADIRPDCGVQVTQYDR